MKLRELIDIMHHAQKVQIRNEEGWEICTCKTNSEGVLPYMNYFVIAWFGNYQIPETQADFVVLVKETENETELDKEPTTDVVPVIRCKDCIHNEHGNCNFYLNFHHMTGDMDYCSDAERREQ